MGIFSTQASCMAGAPELVFLLCILSVFCMFCLIGHMKGGVRKKIAHYHIQ